MGVKGAFLPVSGGWIKTKGMRKRDLSDKIEKLDLRPMPPFERHEKIFQIWDTFTPRETLKIINDHDPKPLRCQFEAEGGKFKWGYDQEGPTDWIVKIKRI